MQPATGARATGNGETGSQRGIGRPGEAEAAPDEQSHERFGVEDFVCEPQRHRVGKVVIIHRPPPILYGIQLADGKTGYAYDRDVRAATDVEVRKYRQDAERWRTIRAR